jgi:RNA polymerase sigma-70 factor, ECF subfamily
VRLRIVEVRDEGQPFGARRHVPRVVEVHQHGIDIARGHLRPHVRDDDAVRASKPAVRSSSRSAAITSGWSSATRTVGWAMPGRPSIAVPGGGGAARWRISPKIGDHPAMWPSVAAARACPDVGRTVPAAHAARQPFAPATVQASVTRDSSAHESDLLVVARARGGDTEAFRILVERHSRYLFAVAHRLVGNVEDAQDVVQDTWLKAHRQLAGFESRADVRTWLTRVAVNCAIDHIRGRRYRELAHDPADLQQGPLSERAVVETPTADRLLFGVEMQERLASALTSLTALERAAFMLRHVEGLSIDEIGNALDLRTSATKHCIFRAVRKVRVALASFAGA